MAQAYRGAGYAMNGSQIENVVSVLSRIIKLIYVGVDFEYIFNT